MKAALSYLVGGSCLMGLLFGGTLMAEPSNVDLSGSPSSKPMVEGDNTGVNRADRQNNKLTAEDQAKGSRKDGEITRRIRAELMKNSDLSSYGQNVKIITLDGIVTLRGPVKSSQERDWIASSAQKTSGVRSIQNEMTISE